MPFYLIHPLLTFASHSVSAHKEELRVLGGIAVEATACLQYSNISMKAGVNSFAGTSVSQWFLYGINFSSAERDLWAGKEKNAKKAFSFSKDCVWQWISALDLYLDTPCIHIHPHSCFHEQPRVLRLCCISSSSVVMNSLLHHPVSWIPQRSKVWILLFKVSFYTLLLFSFVAALSFTLQMYYCKKNCTSTSLKL